MAQPAGYSKNPLNINPFWVKASVDPPLEWCKWAAILEIVVFAKNGIEAKSTKSQTIASRTARANIRSRNNGRNRGTKEKQRSETKRKELVGRTTL